jgi:hypothetical protein
VTQASDLTSRFAPAGEPTIQDGFDSDTGWEYGEFGSGAISRLDSRLVIAVRGPSQTLHALAPVPVLTDFFMEVELLAEICDASDEFGLIARTSGADTHYRFMITCDGSIRASRFSAGTEAALYPITPDGAVIPGAPAQNRLAVSAIGNQLRFLVNDIQVMELSDRLLQFGRVGLIVRARRGSQATVSFDNFRLWDLSVPADG